MHHLCMNKFIIFISLSIFSSFAISKEVTFYIGKVDGATVWLPKAIEVQPEEEIEIFVTHKEKDVKPEHGFFVPEFKIDTLVRFGEEKKSLGKFKAPKNTGEYKIACLLHTTHQPAFLVVKSAKK